MNIAGRDSEIRVEVAEPVNVDVSHNIHRRGDVGILENPLQILLHLHVRTFMAIEHPGRTRRPPRGHQPTPPHDPLIPHHAPLQQGCQHRDDQRGGGLLLVGEAV